MGNLAESMSMDLQEDATISAAVCADPAAAENLYWSSAWKEWDAVERLLGSGADPNGYAHVDSGNTALHQAVYSDHGETVTKLIAAKANLNAQNKSGNTALHLAAREGNVPLLSVLTKAGADGTLKNTINLTATEILRGAGKKDVASALQKQVGQVQWLANTKNEIASITESLPAMAQEVA